MKTTLRAMAHRRLRCIFIVILCLGKKGYSSTAGLVSSVAMSSSHTYFAGECTNLHSLVDYQWLGLSRASNEYEAGKWKNRSIL
jgi:hypothetical protein